MRKPVIGITADYLDARPAYYISYGYVDAVVAAGGLPLILPFRTDVADIPRLVDMIDGIVFTGGNDLDPAAWGETLHPQAVQLDPVRERFERLLMAEVERRRMPALGICLGSQLMNVHRGGSMKQFIPDLGLSPALEHRRQNHTDARHAVTVSEGSKLHQILGTTSLVANSAHKQAMGSIGRGLRVVATAPDGVIEGLEDPALPFWVGVQWHPERIYTEGVQIRLFSALVEASKGEGGGG